MGEEMIKWMHRLMVGWIYGWVDKWVHKLVDGSLDEWVDFMCVNRI